MQARIDQAIPYFNHPLSDITALIIRKLPQAAAARFLISKKSLYASHTSSLINGIWRQWFQSDFPGAYRDLEATGEHTHACWFDLYRFHVAKNDFFLVVGLKKYRPLYFAMLNDDLAVVRKFESKLTLKGLVEVLFTNYVGTSFGLLRLASTHRSQTILNYLYQQILSNTATLPHFDKLSLAIICQQSEQIIRQLPVEPSGMFSTHPPRDNLWDLHAPHIEALLCNNERCTPVALNARNIGRLSYLDQFASHGDFALIKTYLHSEQLEFRSEALCNSMRGAIKGGYAAQLNDLLSEQKELYAKNAMMRPASILSLLQSAVYQDQRACLKVLMDFQPGENLESLKENLVPIEKANLLMMAIFKARPTTFQLLLSALINKGIDLSFIVEPFIDSDDAIKHGAAENWQHLIDLKARIEFKTRRFDSAGRMAFRHNPPLTLRLLSAGNLVTPSLLSALGRVKDLHTLKELPAIAPDFLLQAIRDALPADVLNAIVVRSSQPIVSAISPEAIAHFSFTQRTFILQKAQRLATLLACTQAKRAAIKAELVTYLNACKARSLTDYKAKISLFGRTIGFGYPAQTKSAAATVAIAIVDGNFDEEEYTKDQLSEYFAALTDGALGNIFNKTGIDLTAFAARGKVAPVTKSRQCVSI